MYLVVVDARRRRRPRRRRRKGEHDHEREVNGRRGANGRRSTASSLLVGSSGFLTSNPVRWKGAVGRVENPRHEPTTDGTGIPDVTVGR
jgi:hypothetical protein